MRVMNLLIIPKESYPLKRVRLTQLYIKEFAEIGNTLIWSVNSSQKSKNYIEVKKGYNIFEISPSIGHGNFLLNFINRYYRIRKNIKIKEILLKKEVDIIIANDGIIEGLIALYFAKKFRKIFAFYLSSIFYEFDRISFKKYMNLKNFIKFLESFPKEIIFKYLIKKADIFHPISSNMVNHFNIKNVAVFPLPICASNFFINMEKECINKCDNGIKLIYIGGIGPIREIEKYILIVKGLVNKGYTIKLKIVGRSTDKKYLKYLLKIIKENNLTEYISIENEKPIKEIPNIILNSDIGLSIIPPYACYKSSSPTKIIEYLSCGVPVVANFEIMDQEYIINMSEGGLLSKYELDEIVKKIEILINNKELRLKMGKKGKKWIIENRSYHKLAKDLFIFYNNYLDK